MSSSLKITKKSARDYALYSAIIVVGIILDQITKWLSVKFLSVVDTVPIIKNVIHLTYVENRGAAFGMFKDQRWIFMTTSTVMIVGLIAFLYLGFAENKLYEISIAMIISGGIGNMIDRLSLKYVVDFIEVKLIYFPYIFNVADCCVVIGCSLIALQLIIEIINEKKEKKKAEISSLTDDEIEKSGE